METKGKRPVIVRVVFFVLALVIAIGGITAGVMQLSNKESGYYKLEVSDQYKTVVYDSGITCYYHGAGSSSEIKTILKLAGESYSKALYRYYTLFDEDTLFDGVDNIAVLNNSVGESILVEPELYEVLKEAYGLTKENKGYSVFDGVMFSEWETLRYLENPADFDPVLNKETADRMADIKQNSKDAFELEFDNGRVCFTASEEYKAFAGENEITASALSLGALKQAFIMRYIAAEMEKEGINDGFLVSDTGLTLMLSGMGNMSYALYSKDGETAQMQVSGGDALMQYNAFPVGENSYGYYSIEFENRAIARNAYISVMDEQAFETLLIAKQNGDIVSIASMGIGMLNNNQADGDVFAAYIPMNSDTPVLYQSDSDIFKLTSAAEKTR